MGVWQHCWSHCPLGSRSHTCHTDLGPSASCREFKMEHLSSMNHLQISEGIDA